MPTPPGEPAASELRRSGAPLLEHEEDVEVGAQAGVDGLDTDAMGPVRGPGGAADDLAEAGRGAREVELADQRAVDDHSDLAGLGGLRGDVHDAPALEGDLDRRVLLGRERMTAAGRARLPHGPPDALHLDALVAVLEREHAPGRGHRPARQVADAIRRPRP